MASKAKSWSELEADIAETFRKWHRDPPLITNTLPAKSRQKRYHDAVERTVSIEFPWYKGGAGLRIVKLQVRRADRAQDNLALIAGARNDSPGRGSRRDGSAGAALPPDVSRATADAATATAA